MTTLDSPDVAAAKRLRDTAKLAGFVFERVAPGENGPLYGVRDTPEHRDEIYLGGFGDRCYAARRRKSSLVVPGGLPITERVRGDALVVLHTVVSDWTT